MTYFTGNVKYETQGLLSPRKDTETVMRLNQLEFLRFVAALHYLANVMYPKEILGTEGWLLACVKSVKLWGYVQPNFLFMLSGFILAYNYCPTLSDDSRIGYNYVHFLLKRACWLCPTMFVACFLPVWRDPIEFLGSTYKYSKFMANLFGISAWWPPSFRTYHLMSSSWVAAVMLFNYVVCMPLMLKAIHRGLSRESRIWLLIFAWPWTWFVGFVFERFDIATDDGTTHWDWVNPLFYVPSFAMGMLGGSIFVEKPEGGTLDPRKLFMEHFGASCLLGANVLVMAFFSHEPMMRWHQVGSLNLLNIGMIYLYAKGKDKVTGWVFGMWPLKFLGGFAFVMIMMYPACEMFAMELTEGLKYTPEGTAAKPKPTKFTFFVTYGVVCALTRFLIEIPYARFALKKCEKMFEGGGD